MPYDEDLASRIRVLLADEADVVERRMFGGLAFMVAGHMAVGVSGQGGLMLRCDPEEAAALQIDPQAEPMEMRGRPMTGWLRVDEGGVQDDADLSRWVTVGVDRAHALPPK